MSIKTKKSTAATTAEEKSGRTTVLSSKREEKLSKQDLMFVDKYLEHGNGTEAAIWAYKIKDRDYARVKASTQLTKPNIKEAVARGSKTIAEYLSDPLLAQTHLEGLKATSVRFTPEGEQIDVADYSTRHKYLDSAYKIKGAYAPEKSLNVSITLSEEEREKLEAMAFKTLRELDA